MKLGIIADIHEATDYLDACLQRLQLLHVDRVITLGDIYELGHRLDQTCRLLAGSSVSGVWGNHDFGLCQPDVGEIGNRFAPESVAYMQSLTARLQVEDCHFAHIEPWLNPESLEDLWFFDGAPTTAQRRTKIFSSQPERILFAGHYHRWLLVSPDETIAWDGKQPISLSDGRYFVVVNALVNRAFATYDTESGLLTPQYLES